MDKKISFSKRSLSPLTGKIRQLLLPVAAVVVSLIITPQLFPKAQEVPEIQNQSEPKLHLGLIPSQSTVLAGQNISFDIVAQALELNPTAVELHLSFDPNYFDIPDNPITPGTLLPVILPNCAQGTLETPCPTVTQIQQDRLSIIISRTCTQDGCDLTPPSGLTTLATLNLTAKPEAIGKTTLSLIDITDDPNYYTISSAVDHDWDITGNRASGSITVTGCELNHDFDADGQISVADIMQAASLWLTDISQPLYNGQFDLTKSGSINISDIQQIANTWGQTCDTTPPVPVN